MIVVAFSFTLVTCALWTLLLNAPELRRISETVASWLLVAWVSYKLAIYIRRTVFGRTLPIAGKAVLITGCDTGFGNLLARKLAAKGYHVYAGCLFSQGAGAQVLAECRGIQVIQMDVTSDDDIHSAYEDITKSLGQNVLWAVVLNAGTLDVGLVEWQNLESIRSAFDVNVLGAVRVSKKFMPLLRKSRGRLVVMTSLLAHLTLPGATVYCMCKHATSSLAEGLRRECDPFGVHVSSIEPTGFQTSLVAGVVERMNVDLKNVPREVLEDFGNHRISAFCDVLNLVLRGALSSNLQQVIDVMTLAIEESSPRNIYSAGSTLQRFLLFLPSEWLDFLLASPFKFMMWWTPDRKPSLST
ncbi:17-beta-hydroxysteroid dehydrogenase type 6 [Ixodes scapularis]|uniref:17-beta-hydroxysteroid dehydrogenase type 6 n=1 Tax=Ixodes scapularis TaxID=6945 RepID=UPI001A9FF34E|nr:17-beta-hydroxysteroid dehydrogenase type 6 [Ixodes scapularis]